MDSANSASLLHHLCWALCCTEMISETLVKRIKKWAESEPLVISAHIFGSRARSDHKPNSDLDVAVKIAKRKGDENILATWIFEKKELLNRISKEIPEYKIDLQWLEDGEESIVKNGVEESGIHIYEKIEPSTT